jgi:dTDP-4-dehydrorhamnose reductase
MTMSRVLITGISGMLGKSVARQMKQTGRYEVFGVCNEISKDPAVISGDLLNKTFVRTVLDQVKPTVIVHCAANVSIEDCEAHKDTAHALHIDASCDLASYKPIDTKFVYISTDSVYNGQSGMYSETSKTGPTNYYALSKLEGEHAVLQANANALILRTNIYGINSFKKRSLAEWAIQNLIERKQINGFTDVYFNPLYTKQLADVIIELLSTSAIGIVNAGSSDHISKYDFLCKLSQAFGFDTSLIGKATIDAASMVTRPKNTTMNTSKLGCLIDNVPSVQEGLVSMKQDYDHARELCS